MSEKESKKPKVIVVGAGVNGRIDPEIIKELAEAGASEIIGVNSLDGLDDVKVPERKYIPDMEDLMITVKNKENARKKRLRDMGRAQFKKKNRRKI